MHNVASHLPSPDHAASDAVSDSDLAASAADTDLADEAVALVGRWLTTAATLPTDRAAARLAMLLKDPASLEFTVAFVDQVIRPEDPRTAARAMAELATRVPGSLPLPYRAALRLGAFAGRMLPGVVVPVVRHVLRTMVAHLIVDARPRRLDRTIAAISGPGVRLNMNLLGEAVLGEQEAANRLRGTHALLARPD
ncbi:MAG: 1-pyrroline-5-carboxylate dehydrogenase, partial [Cellulomonadaceae bacterium]